MQNDDANEDDYNNDMDTVSGPDTNHGDTVLPLDLAILRSVEMCSNDDTKIKMLSSILVVGAGFRCEIVSWQNIPKLHINILNLNQSKVSLMIMIMTSFFTRFRGAAQYLQYRLSQLVSSVQCEVGDTHFFLYHFQTCKLIL